MLQNARNILVANKDFCIEEAMAYVASQTASQTNGFAGFPQTPTSVEFCRRDITFVIEAYISGLTRVDSVAINFIASRYWVGKKSALVGDRTKEISTHAFLKDLIVNYVLKNIAFASQQTNSTQIGRAHV